VCGSRAGMDEIAGEEGKRHLSCSACFYAGPSLASGVPTAGTTLRIPSRTSPPGRGPFASGVPEVQPVHQDAGRPPGNASVPLEAEDLTTCTWTSSREGRVREGQVSRLPGKTGEGGSPRPPVRRPAPRPGDHAPSRRSRRPDGKRVDLATLIASPTTSITSWPVSSACRADPAPGPPDVERVPGFPLRERPHPRRAPSKLKTTLTSGAARGELPRPGAAESRCSFLRGPFYPRTRSFPRWTPWPRRGPLSRRGGIHSAAVGDGSGFSWPRRTSGVTTRWTGSPARRCCGGSTCPDGSSPPRGGSPPKWRRRPPPWASP